MYDMERTSPEFTLLPPEQQKSELERMFEALTKNPENCRYPVEYVSFLKLLYDKPAALRALGNYDELEKAALVFLERYEETNGDRFLREAKSPIKYPIPAPWSREANVDGVSCISLFASRWTEFFGKDMFFPETVWNEYLRVAACMRNLRDLHTRIAPLMGTDQDQMVTEDIRKFLLLGDGRDPLPMSVVVRPEWFRRYFPDEQTTRLLRDAGEELGRRVLDMTYGERVLRQAFQVGLSEFANRASQITPETKIYAGFVDDINDHFFERLVNASEIFLLNGADYLPDQGTFFSNWNRLPVQTAEVEGRVIKFVGLNAKIFRELRREREETFNQRMPYREEMIRIVREFGLVPCTDKEAQAFYDSRSKGDSVFMNEESSVCFEDPRLNENRLCLARDNDTYRPKIARTHVGYFEHFEIFKLAQ